MFDESAFSDIAARDIAVIVGRQNDVPTTWASRDGEVWTATVLDPSHGVYAHHVTVSGGHWMISGVEEVSDGFAIRLWSSPDGSHWIPLSPVGLPVLHSPGPPDVHALEGAGENVVLATTADVAADGTVTAVHLRAFLAPQRDRYTENSLAALPATLPSIGIYQAAAHGAGAAALGIACRGPDDNPPCRFFGLSTTGAHKALLLSPVIDDPVLYLDTPLSAAAGPTGFAITGSGHAWLIDGTADMGRLVSGRLVTPSFQGELAPPGRFVGVASDGGKWYGLVMSGGSYAVVSSDDGATWQPIAAPPCCTEFASSRGFAILGGRVHRAIVVDANFNDAGAPVGLAWADVGG